MFCSYVSDGRYGWVAFCEKQFGDVPSQICFEWNTPQHTTDDAVPPKRRAFTKPELQHMFDVVDDFVDEQHRNGSKRWMTALRDSIAFKIGYAYGLRRQELVMLDLTDFGPNPHVPRYRRLRRDDCSVGQGHEGVRTAPADSADRSGVPLGQSSFCSIGAPKGRELFTTADRSPALWPSERGGRLTLNALGRSFTVAPSTGGSAARS